MPGVQGLRVFGYRGSGFARVVGFRVKGLGFNVNRVSGRGIQGIVGFRQSGIEGLLGSESRV